MCVWYNSDGHNATHASHLKEYHIQVVLYAVL